MGIRRIHRLVVTAVLSLALFLFLFSSPVWADDYVTDEITTVLENIRLWIMGIAGVLVAVMLTIAGVRYVLGAGDPGETEKAKTALRAAAIGFAIIVLAPVLVEILKGILGVSEE